MSKIYSFSTKDYRSSPVIEGILRRYLAEKNISGAGIAWILKDINPRLESLASNVSIEVADDAYHVADYFSGIMHKVTSRTLVELINIEIELYRARHPDA